MHSGRLSVSLRRWGYARFTYRELPLTPSLNQSAERMKKTIIERLTNWMAEFSLSIIVICVGAALLVFLPEGKQGVITTPVYSGSAGWAVVLIGSLGLANSVRRAVFKKRA